MNQTIYTCDKVPFENKQVAFQRATEINVLGLSMPGVSQIPSQQDGPIISQRLKLGIFQA